MSQLTSSVTGLRPLWAVSIAMAFVPLAAGPDVLGVLCLAVVYGLLSSTWNIIGGIAGQFSMGNAAFFGLGAYAPVFLYVRFGVTPYVGILVGIALAMLCAWMLGQLSFRILSFGMFPFILLTFSFAEIVRSIFLGTSALGGAEGIVYSFDPGLHSLQFRSPVPYYYGALVLMMATIGGIWRLRESRLGIQMELVREDEAAARSVGIDASKVKLRALLLSAALTAPVGSLFGLLFSFVKPDSVFTVHLSITMLVGAAIGGMGTTYGPLLGGASMYLVNEALLRLPLGGGLGSNLSVILYGLVLIAGVRLLPQGLLLTLGRETVRSEQIGMAWLLPTRNRRAGVGTASAVSATSPVGADARPSREARGDSHA